MFVNIEDHINKRPYPVDDLPVSYGPVHPYFMKPKSPGPFHLPYEGEVGRGRLCICHMVDLHFQKIPFTIMYQGDVIDIETNIRYYLQSVNEFVEKLQMTPEKAEYVRRMSEFYKVIKKSAQRILAANTGKAPLESSSLMKMLEIANR